jgi:hypothetical protein
MRISDQTLSTTARSQREQGRGHETTKHEQWAEKGDAPNKSPINQMFVFQNHAKKLCASATR